ncbi:hypothetical protein RO3G_03285 [Rhizopus delemar RA 99-880]|uniref:PDZ domain-containing protein n=1 Tax=Rhizopus delemar (strain RA 99-880 / ATCC MYA-4621 / FGSC 9543 / NRRL 43880) TaxID=246409 RepID=I1BQV1_RHIO9|nr:hypothetical protein RO3G_03285 [Rhizopus delemar RA 99-880]|eukprot:EIE78581.1 hypothetical protein RO3G_03285 [Rhizopus delemar RA 99-880]
MPRQIEPLILDKNRPVLLDHTSGFDITKYKSPNSILDGAKSITTQSNISKKEELTWENTLERCIKSIVSIKGYRARGLDTELPGVFTASGFIVDPYRGIILSNRHVVSVSPISVQAVLRNYEEITLIPIYRDPVHDFGFFRYDPSKIRFLDVPGIQLYPQGAKIGQDIRVVGNDAGEKLSILSGTLARLDREAPNYGIGEYNDFNTFYYQAASSTSSGSSGSPVLDLYGRAIALNAGGASTSSSSYYLPLDRAQRVLRLIQDDKPISRGTIQTVFEYMPYDSLLQLGLSQGLEKKLRSLYGSSLNGNVNEGLLVVKSILLDGPASGYLEPGDILLSCNGNLLFNLFIDLEEALDNAAEMQKPVQLTVSRAGELREFTIDVENLHAITPYRYLEFGGGVINDLSYQIAKSYGLSLKEGGVYVGAAGFILGNARVLRKSIIVGVNNKQVKTIDDFIENVSRVSQGKRIPIRYYSLLQPMKTRIMILHIDWRWHKFQLAIRNDKTGYWDYKNLPTPLDKELYSSRKTSTKALNHSLDKDAENVIDQVHSLTLSMVSIDCNPPFVVDGSKNSHSYGAGVIVSLDPPLIICDRDTVPIGISVISITFQNTLTISADLLFLHPFYNFAVLKFDVSAVFSAGIKIKAAEFDEKDLKIGETVNYIGLSAPIRTKETSPARWRAVNVEVFKVSGGTLSSQGGVFADNNGKVRAVWASFSIDTEANQLSSILGGLPARLILPILDSIKLNKEPVIYGLDAEFWSLQLSNARFLGLNEEWISKYKSQAIGDKKPSVLYVLGITDPSTTSGKMLRNGDLALEINGKIPTSISDLALFNTSSKLNMTILRDGKELNLSIPTTRYDGKETTDIIGWQGMIVQEPHSAAKEQVRKHVPEGVYVSCCLLGSPAQAYLKPSIWITEINRMPVKSIEDFIAAVTVTQENKQPIRKAIQLEELYSNEPITENLYGEEKDDILDSDSHVRIKYVTADNITHVTAIRLDRHYWPTWRVKKDDDYHYGWRLTSFD